jgi:hypothetical protein
VEDARTRNSLNKSAHSFLLIGEPHPNIRQILEPVLDEAVAMFSLDPSLGEFFVKEFLVSMGRALRWVF